jgi:hypothetical protein
MIASRRQQHAQHRAVEHGLPTAAVGRYVASADRPPPWTGLPLEPSNQHRLRRRVVHPGDYIAGVDNSGGFTAIADT